MNARRVVVRNALASVVQVVVSGVVLFVLYRSLILRLGQARVGVWSLVLAVTAVTRISDLGFAASAIRFVARLRAEGDEVGAAVAQETAVVSVALAVAVLALLGGAGCLWLLPRLVDALLLPEAISILPLSLVSLWLGAIAAAVAAGLDGVMRVDVRSSLGVAGNVLYLAAALALTPGEGLMGLAVAQCLQGGVVAIGGWWLLRRELVHLPLFPWRVNAVHFRRMLSYGASFQAVSVTNWLLEPATKVLLAKFGTLGQVAYFEMASRMVSQVRMLLVSSFQVLVPVFAGLELQGDDRVRSAYRRANGVMWLLGAPVFSLLAIGAPVLAWVWIGKPDYEFTMSAQLAVGGWAANTVVVPAYVVNLGTGELRLNTLSHVVIGVFNLVLGSALGWAFGGRAVVAGWSAALVAGSVVLLFGFHRRYALGWRDVVPGGSRILAGGCLVLGVSGAIWSLRNAAVGGTRLSAVAVLVAAMPVVLGLMWGSAGRSELLSWVTGRLKANI